MASALTIPELMAIVFEHSNSPKDLLNFAFVCRQWTEWALDVRWRIGEVPLSDVLKILHITENSDVPSWNVDDATWNKFISVSNKVTSLKPNLILLPAAVAYFNDCQGQHLDDVPFRNVRKLIIQMRDTDFRTVSTVCSGAPIKSILMRRTMELPGRRNLDWQAGSLAQPWPEVEEISVDYPFTRSLPKVSPFTQLRVLYCHTSSTHHGWWRDLPNCSNLVEIWFRETQGFAVGYETAWLEDQVSVFPKLEKFHYTGDAGVSGEVLAMIARSSFPSLRQLSLSPCPRPNRLERITPHLRQNSPYLRDFQLGADYVAKE
ncbi:hypothetical protein FRC04_008735 [Tulasnella sp. 424]|nr:hypothetical protein FRC04_008735 [Tulasnella sp. 424]KAG8979966.1 hypothetical protein FRC05_007409 [Tulasnella sp. 425]